MHEPLESPLIGGWTKPGIVRIGNTVHRPLDPRSDFTHLLLKQLEEKQFDGAPRFLGIDDKQREILTFIEGEVPHREIQWTDDQLIIIVHLLKRFHDATVGTKLAGDQEVVCHNDVTPWNIVIRNDQPIALIDFDEAAPGRRVDDFAHFIWRFLELGNDVAPEIQATRIRKLCIEYGLTSGSELIDTILRQQKKTLTKLDLWATNTSNPESRKFLTATTEKIHSDMAWIEENKTILEAYTV